MFFDSLDDSISEILKKSLKSLDYSKLVDFFSVREIFRPMIFEIINELNLKVEDDCTTNCHILSKEDANKLVIT